MKTTWQSLSPVVGVFYKRIIVRSMKHQQRLSKDRLAVAGVLLGLSTHRSFGAPTTSANEMMKTTWQSLSPVVGVFYKRIIVRSMKHQQRLSKDRLAIAGVLVGLSTHRSFGAPTTSANEMMKSETITYPVILALGIIIFLHRKQV